MNHENTLGSRPDISAAVNVRVRQSLVQALGELTLQGITDAGRADILTTQLQQTQEAFTLLQTEIEMLRDEVTSAGTIPDVRKLDYDTLVLELKHRGYTVTADNPTPAEKYRDIGKVRPDLPQDAQPIDGV